MPRRARTSRRLLAIGKWTGLALCLASLLVWVATRRWISDPIVLDIARVLGFIMLVPTWTLLIISFRRSRLSLPGHCRCGYNLAGLDGKPCPECGRPGERAK